MIGEGNNKKLKQKSPSAYFQRQVYIQTTQLITKNPTAVVKQAVFIHRPAGSAQKTHA